MRFFFVVLAILTFVSCNSKEKNIKSFSGGGKKVKVIENNFIVEKDKSFESIFIKKSDVELKTDNKYYIAKIKKVIITKNNYLIADNRGKQLLVFDKNGNFKKIIGKVGKAPGEYESIFDIDVNSKNQLLLLDVNLQRVSKFNFDGNYISSFKVQPGFSICSDLNNGFYLYNPTESGIAEKVAIKHYNNLGKIDYSFCKPFFNIGMVGCNLIRDNQGNLFVIHSSEYIIKKYNSNGKFLNEFGYKPKYYKALDIKKNRFPSPEKLQEFTPLMKIAITKEFIFIEIGRTKPKATWLDIYDTEGKILISGLKLPADLYLGNVGIDDNIIYFIKTPSSELNENSFQIPNFRILGYLIK